MVCGEWHVELAEVVIHCIRHLLTWREHRGGRHDGEADVAALAGDDGRDPGAFRFRIQADIRFADVHGVRAVADAHPILKHIEGLFVIVCHLHVIAMLPRIIVHALVRHDCRHACGSHVPCEVAIHVGGLRQTGPSDEHASGNFAGEPGVFGIRPLRLPWRAHDGIHGHTVTHMHGHGLLVHVISVNGCVHCVVGCNRRVGAIKRDGRGGVHRLP